VLCLVLPAPCATRLLAAQGKEITASELLKLGFFQDFEELNLEELLGASEVKTAVASGLEQTVE